jgi:hypothetical protein
VPHIHGETKDPQALVCVKCLSHFAVSFGETQSIFMLWYKLFYSVNLRFAKISKIRRQQTVKSFGVKHVDLCIGM